MSQAKAPAAQREPSANRIELGRHLEPETWELLEMASLLGPRDRIALSNIIRRAVELCEIEGEEVALAVLDQVEAILKDRRQADA